MQAIEAAIEQRCEASRTQLQQAHDEAKRVAKQMRLVRHGGCAIEALVPGSVYGAGDIPDIDAFTCRGTNAKKTAHAARHMIKKAGVDGLRIVPAMHKSTYSIRLGRHVIMDVSWVSPEDHKLLLKVAKDEGHPADAMVPPTAYLKMSMHLELCRPAVYIERWRKVWPRLEAVYGAFPASLPKPVPAKKEYSLEDVFIPEEEDMLRTACDMGCVIVGRHLVHKLTGEDWMRSWPMDLVLPSWPDDEETISPDAVLSELCARLELKKIVKPAARGMFGPPHYRLLKDGEYVARVHVVDTEVCTARDDDGLAYGTSDLALHLMYSELLRSASVHDSQRARLAEAIDAVTAAQAAHASDASTPSSIHQRFTPFNRRPVCSSRPLSETTSGSASATSLCGSESNVAVTISA